MTFPFVKAAVEAEELSLHGIWNEIGEGELETYDPLTSTFHKI